MRLPPETEARQKKGGAQSAADKGRRAKDGAQRATRKGRREKDSGQSAADKGRRAKGDFGRIGAFARKKAIWAAKIVDKTRKKR